MTEAPKRIWVDPTNTMTIYAEAKVWPNDVSYVRADVAYEHKRQRDRLLAELKRYHQAADHAWEELHRQGDAPNLIGAGRRSLDDTAALIAECEGGDDG